MKRIVLMIGVGVLAVTGAWAYGGGGLFRGAFLPVDGYSNVRGEAQIVGGYGYGVDRSGTRTGGFGLVIHDTTNGELVGAFGGIITGSQLRGGPFTVSVNLWTGIGHANPRVVGASSVAYLLEADVEAGVAILPWMQIGVYGGMQVMGSLDPAHLVPSARYTPVVGTRLTWGRF